jgi:hypothetical protein
MDAAWEAAVFGGDAQSARALLAQGTDVDGMIIFPHDAIHVDFMLKAA